MYVAIANKQRFTQTDVNVNRSKTSVDPSDGDLVLTLKRGKENELELNMTKIEAKEMIKLLTKMTA